MKARRERLETRIIRRSTDIFLFPASSSGCALRPDLGTPSRPYTSMNVLKKKKTPRPQRGPRGEALGERAREARREEGADGMNGKAESRGRGEAGERGGGEGEERTRGVGAGDQRTRRGRGKARTRVYRPAAAGGGAAGGEMRGLLAAAPLRRGPADCSTPGCPAAPAACARRGPGREAPALRVPAPHAPQACVAAAAASSGPRRLVPARG